MGGDEKHLDGILGDLADNLQYRIDEGERVVEIDPAVVKALSGSPAPTAAAAAQAPVAQHSAEQAEAPAPAPPRAENPETVAALEKIAIRIAGCKRCSLCQKRTNTVPGQGATSPEIAFVGEGPGADEDAQGLAFVGRAGKLLTKMIEGMGLTRDEVWIGNIVKCRPPDNRAPLPDEMEECMPYLKEQLARLQPKVIICLGATAVKALLETKTGITKLRGTWMSFEGIDVMPTFPPAYLLRNPPTKKDCWEDLKEVLRHLGKPIPTVKRRA